MVGGDEEEGLKGGRGEDLWFLGWEKRHRSWFSAGYDAGCAWEGKWHELQMDQRLDGRGSSDRHAEGEEGK